MADFAVYQREEQDRQRQVMVAEVVRTLREQQFGFAGTAPQTWSTPENPGSGQDQNNPRPSVRTINVRGLEKLDKLTEDITRQNWANYFR